MNYSKDETLLKQELELEINSILKTAYANLNTGNIEEAEKIYLGIIDVQPLNAEANHNLGIIEFKTNRATNALLRLEIAIQTKPENEQYWISYIDALIIFEDYPSAQAAINLGLEYGLSTTLATTLQNKIQQHNSEKQQRNLKVNFEKPPLITTLIPAYKSAFIFETLLSLTAQTYQFFEVIVSDDSPDQVITQLIASPEFSKLRDKLKLTVLQGPRQGGMSNILHLLNHCNDNGLIHILMDDDLIYPRFYEKHIQAHLTSNISASVSYRWFCNQLGQPMWVSAVPEWVNNSQDRFMAINSSQLFNSVIPNCDNWLGEFSNSVFKPAAIRLYGRSRLENIAYYGLGDIGTLLEASLHGDLGLIKEYLGAFRQHDTQYSSQKNTKVFQCGVIAWVALALGAYRAQLLSADNLQIVANRICNNLTQLYPDDKQIHTIIQSLNMNTTSNEQFSNEFIQRWEKFIVCQDWQKANSLLGATLI